jgi:RNA polymerase sigma-70 factor, ECF subfamily
MPSSDGELLERLLRGEAAAWRTFVERYGPTIRCGINRIVRRFSSLLTRSDAEDIYASFLHSLLVRDMHKLRSFDSGRGTTLSTWMGRLATNAAWDHLRVAARAPVCAFEPGGGAAPSHGPDPLSSLVAKESYERVQRTVGELSSKDQTFVELFFLMGSSPEQIADKMKISVKTVYSKKHKVRSRLQGAVDETRTQRPRHAAVRRASGRAGERGPPPVAAS